MGKRSISKPLFCIKHDYDHDTIKRQHCNGRDNEEKHASELFSYPVEVTLTS